MEVDAAAAAAAAAAATAKADDEDSGRGSLNSGSQTVICIFIPKLDVKVTHTDTHTFNGPFSGTIPR